MKSQYPELYAKQEEALAGESEAWLADFRSRSALQFSEQGFPSLSDEEWRYSNVSLLEKKAFTPVLASKVATVDKELIATHQLEGCWMMVFVDGHYSEALSDVAGLPESVQLMNLAQAVSKDSEQVQTYLGKIADNQAAGFGAFNSAWFSDGAFVRVAKNTQVEKPIQLLHIVTSENVLANTRHIVVLEQGAEAEVIEMFVGASEQYATVSVMEVFVEKNAGLTLYKKQLEASKAAHLGGVYVQQARDSRFTHHNFALGALLARTEVHTDLYQAAECDLNGLYLGSKRQNLDNHTRINHLQAHGVSRELYKGVLNDKSRGVFQGRVVVAEQAQKTDSDMHNHNLLLSDTAEADTKPQLEIYADDVKCAHGITVGQLDDKAIFSLQSRGIDKETAKNMLTFAFANEMVSKIKLKPLHEQLLKQVLNRFPQSGIDRAWL